jgi:hypothetical protein
MPSRARSDACSAERFGGGTCRVGDVLSKRDGRIDFLRGYALLAIFVDHVPHQLLSLVTLHSFALADAAELFFFISGFTAAMVYSRTLEGQGFLAAAIRIWRRTWKIYAAQLILFVFVVAEVAAFVALTSDKTYFYMFRLAPFFEQTSSSLLPVLLMNYQPGYLDVLPLYVLFFLALPWILFAARKNIWYVLVPSFLLYLAVQFTGWNLHTYPWGAGWFLNPLAWQFLFVLGVAISCKREQLKTIPNWLFWPTAALCAMVAVVQARAELAVFVPAVGSWDLSGLGLDKTNMSWARVVSFMALAAVAVRLLPEKGVMERYAVCRAIMCCGRHSLQVFCLGALCSGIGALTWELTGHSLMLQLLFGLFGLAVLFAAAYWLDWLKQFDRAPATSANASASLPAPAR